MRLHDKDRAEQNATAKELASELALIFPQAETCGITAYDPNIHFDDPHKKDPKIFLAWNESQGLVHAFIYRSGAESPCVAVSLRPLQRPYSRDLKFAGKYLRVFNKDIEIAPLVLEHGEQWEALAASRASRSIARINKFQTGPFLRCLTAMEAASNLKYEGSDFHATIFLVQRSLRRHTPPNLVRLPTPIPFQKALLDTKWLRAVADEEGIGLYSDLKTIYGIASLPGGPDGERSLLLPQDLRRVSVSIGPGMRVLVCAKNGDLYVISPDGLVFVKSQGQWRYFNYQKFRDILAAHLPTELTDSLLQLLLDLSFSRNGALLCVPRNNLSISVLIADHKAEGRKNLELREAAAHLNILNEAHRRILLASAGVDGAVIISQNGDVLDVACKIVDRSDEHLAVLKVRRQYFEGTRSTAAWNASLEGIAIKVSEDGPISFFSNGQLVGQLG